jgi:hypothetical protein
MIVVTIIAIIAAIAIPNLIAARLNANRSAGGHHAQQCTAEAVAKSAFAARTARAKSTGRSVKWAAR